MRPQPSPFFADRAVAIARINQLEHRSEIVRRAVADSAGTRDSAGRRADGAGADDAVFTNRLQRLGEAADIRDNARPRGRSRRPAVARQIDVEGYEWEVLQGAGEMLERARPVVMLELHLNFLEERGIAATSVTRLLTRNGYDLFNLWNRRLSESRLSRSWASVMHVIARPRR